MPVSQPPYRANGEPLGYIEVENTAMMCAVIDFFNGASKPGELFRVRQYFLYCLNAPIYRELDKRAYAETYKAITTAYTYEACVCALGFLTLYGIDVHP